MTEATAPMNDPPRAAGRDHELEPVTFHLQRSDFWVAIGLAPLFFLMAGALGLLAAKFLEDPGGAGEVTVAGVLVLSGLALCAASIWMIRRGRIQARLARTGEVADPPPEPDKAFLERIAGALHYEGQTFEESWLALDGPMAELMRDYDEEPDERTMGRNGEFAKALRKAGFDLGDAPANADPPLGGGP